MRSLNAGMSTRSKFDKAEVDDLYKIAIKNRGKVKSNSSTLYGTHTLTGSCKSILKSVSFSPVTDNEISEDQPERSIDEPDSDGSVDETIVQGCQTDCSISYKKIARTMANHNLFAT